MESLYAKLYDKYDKLKKKKFAELDDVNKDQELKFLNYVSAAEELIEYLRSENAKLCEQVNNLKTEVDSVRSTNNEQCVEYQNLFMQERQKNKALSQEVERLQKLHQEAISSCSIEGKNDDMLLNTLEGAQTTSGKQSSILAKIMTRKRRREAEAEREGMNMAGDSGQDDAIIGESSKYSIKETAPPEAASDQLPKCCKRTVDTSGGVNDDGPVHCLFQDFIEYLVDMKLSACHQTEGPGISALHQSSGFSFNLTWVKNEATEESELLYRVSSLGTFERVAPDWMRNIIMFSMSMCPMFFERLTRVIKLHH